MVIACQTMAVLEIDAIRVLGPSDEQYFSSIALQVRFLLLKFSVNHQNKCVFGTFNVGYSTAMVQDRAVWLQLSGFGYI
jgi:hypothetical protein